MVRVMLLQHQMGARNAEEMMRLPGYHALEISEIGRDKMGLHAPSYELRPGDQCFAVLHQLLSEADTHE